MALLEQSLSEIRDNYADVIEGGNAYASSTNYKGIAGTQSHDELAGESITADSGASKTTFTQNDLAATRNMVRTDTAPLYLICATATNAANVGAARKVTGFSSSAQITVSPGFPENVTTGDTFTVRQGFKRASERVDLEGEEQDEIRNKYDRVFQIRIGSGIALPWYGNSIETYIAPFTVRLLITKRAKHDKALDSAMENMQLIRSIIGRGEHRDSTSKFTQLLDVESGGPDVEIDDTSKVIIADTMSITYRTDSAFL